MGFSLGLKRFLFIYYLNTVLVQCSYLCYQFKIVLGDGIHRAGTASMVAKLIFRLAWQRVCIVSGDCDIVAGG
jgi:hypothetical protein